MTPQTDIRKTKKICIVDDEAVIVEMYAFKLKQAGYRVITARDGVEGYEVIARERPDLVTTDLIMPRMDGMSLIRKLKEDDELNSIPLIVLTNLSNPRDEEEAAKLGVLFFLVKPHFMPSELLEIIDETLIGRVDG